VSWRAMAWHWVKFNVVGAIGIGVQLAALAALNRVLGNYVVATAIAVELTVLHNFVWHERFTWADRASMSWRDSLVRLLKFNFSNGAISILGNILLMRWFVGEFRLPVVIANLLAIALCGLANFVVGDRFVFRRCENSS